MRLFLQLSAGLAVLALTAGCGGNPSPARDPAADGVQISISHCGSGWSSRPAGHQQLSLHNTDSRPGDAMLADAATGAIYAYLEPLAAGTTTSVAVDLRPGRYRFRCAMEDEDVVDGPVVAVTGPATGAGTPGVLPVTQADLIGPTRRYESYVTGRLPRLATEIGTLVSDLSSHDRARAERDWLTAHTDYEQLGAAYGAFGDADGVINGVATSLPRGVSDPDFTGFHRLEYGLWHGTPLAELRPAGAVLLKAVRGLLTDFTQAQLDPTEVSIRAHEITENAIEFELTGKTDYGSHSNLATVQANLVGTATVLSMLTPLLTPRYPALGTLRSTLARSRQDVAALVDRPLSTLNTTEREQVNADLGALVELLAPVAEICEPRRNS